MGFRIGAPLWRNNEKALTLVPFASLRPRDTVLDSNATCRFRALGLASHEGFVFTSCSLLTILAHATLLFAVGLGPRLWCLWFFFLFFFLWRWFWNRLHWLAIVGIGAVLAVAVIEGDRVFTFSGQKLEIAICLVVPSWLAVGRTSQEPRRSVGCH